MKILGIHDGHNASICYLEDGNIKLILQEERINSQKNYFGFPKLSLDYLLTSEILNVKDIDYFVFDSKHLAYPKNRDEIVQSYSDSYTLNAKIKSLLKKTFIYSKYKKKRKEIRINNLLSLGVERNKIKFIDHHLAHSAAAYFGSPWANKNDKVLVLTQDGSGDGLSGTVNIGKNGKLRRIAEIKKEDSLARIYATTTFMLGMVPLEHEYKLMGMAPYAPDYGREKSYEVFKELLQFSDKNGLVWVRKKGLPPMHMIYPYLKNKTEFHRFDWISAGLQKFTEEMLVQWVKNAIKKTGISKVVLSGGTFMNVKANQKILNISELDKLFIFPSCGDESNSIGAAWYHYYKLNPGAESDGLNHLYHGPDLSAKKDNCLLHLNALKEKNSINFQFTYYEDIESEIAKLLAMGEIVARCKGPMEFGARALGNRSILCDASDLDKVRVINNMIKNRDFWMPFAPVMLEERSKEYIMNPKNMDASYMMITFDTTDKFTEFIGGVQQSDLTARPQIVNKEINQNYYKILKEFEKLTGKGVLLNTSFNLHGLPIVYGPKEALHVFENSGLKYLALGNILVKKNDA